ncbi:unnamed protein product [Rotaria socialis]|uniref:ATP synthase F0 subunit 8 n=1 Tax=Rotaria socialis TaxID=392032 RepID=A0A818ZNP1_9BILA|nr:unnamed protein product [Rotaria socialis]CAF4654414.1 unnamed protein product [Rotaria socialis]
MKLFISFLIITLFVIDGIQNAPAIHPIHVQIIPLHPVTVPPTSDQVTTRKPFIYSVIIHQPSKPSWWYLNNSTGYTHGISTVTSSGSHYHASWWYNSTGKTVLHVFLYAILMACVYKVLSKICKSEKQKTTYKRSNLLVVKNKMCVSTINSKQEELPPSYATIHNV